MVPLFVSLLFFCTVPQDIAGQSAAAGVPGAAALFERGKNSMSLDDWYSAAEAFIECLRLSPAHAEATAALAECYYELGEFDEALVWSRKARALSRGNMNMANLEAVTLVALGQLDGAAAIVSDILAREPYNREALFTAGELDIARGRSADALLRYRAAAQRYPDDRRLLVSMALVSSSLGDGEIALIYINQALARHREDYRVFYYAAYINAQNGSLSQAIRYATQALYFKPGFAPARSLLASLRYRSGQFEEAARLADESIAASREDIFAWYLKGISLTRLGRSSEAITVLGNALIVNPSDEFVRAALEETLIAATGLEDPRRKRWADWHFQQAKDFRSRNLIEQSLFEYRRGLRLDPYAFSRREYAELLRIQGYPARYLEELRFLQDLGAGDRSMNDAVEAYSSLLSNSLFRQWQINPVELAQRYWKIAVFSLAEQSGFYHVDSGAVSAALVKELLVHDRNILPANLELRQLSFSQAFRQAREAGVDYFILVSVAEGERDISIKAELFTGSTGAPAGTFSSYRTGPDRLRNATRGITEQLASSLPFRAKLVMRKQAQGLIDKGRVDGVKAGETYDIVKKGRPQILNQGIGLSYTNDDLAGKITVEYVDEEIALGSIVRNGFFDRIEIGDEIILQAAKGSRTPPETALNPELQNLLRRLR
jgi:tetratricopeptide (TPR) repeat protein